MVDVGSYHNRGRAGSREHNFVFRVFALIASWDKVPQTLCYHLSGLFALTVLKIKWWKQIEKLKSA